MHQLMKHQVADLNPHLICQLCGGYYIDAATIIECLHSFCRSCIVRYLEKNKFCPICEVQVHKTRPLLNIRSDQTLQDIVYKLIPGLYQNEMRLRREFYSKHPEATLPSNPEDRGEPSERFIYSSDETICLSLEYFTGSSEMEQVDSEVEDGEGNGASGNRRYLRCPAAVTVGLLKRLIRGKYGLGVNHILDIICGDSSLRDEFSLVDVAYISNWRRKGPMKLKYRIYERVVSSIPVVNGNSSASSVDNDVKPEEIPQCKDQAAVSMVKDEKADVEMNEEHKIEDHKITGDSSTAETKEVQLEISETGVVSVLKVEDAKATTSSTVVSSGKASDDRAATSMKPPSPKEPSIAPPLSVESKQLAVEPAVVSVNGSIALPSPSVSPPVSPSKKSSSPLGYRTLKSPPKTWNPSVSRVATKRPASTISSKYSSTSITTNSSSNSHPSVSAANNCPSPAAVVSSAGDWDACKPSTPKQSKKTAPLAAPSPPKAPRFFKVRNTTTTTTSGPTSSTTTNHVSSIASVTESPVQEVAVNLTKASHGSKKSSKEVRVPSPSQMIPSSRPSLTSSPPRPSSAPAQLKPQPLISPSALPSPTTCSEDTASKLRNLLAVQAVFSAAPTSACVTATNAAIAESLQLHFPSWLNAVRPGARSPLSVPPGASFLNRPPLPAYLLNMMASQQFPYFPHQLNFGLGTLAPPFPDVKRSPLTPSSPSSTPAGPSSPSVSSASHKSQSPRPSTGLHTPIFNLPPYPPGLAQLLPGLPRDMVGSMYATLSPRPYSPARNNGPVSAGNSVDGQSNSHAFPKMPSSPSGGGYHPSLPPTVSPLTSSKASSSSKSSSGLRPLMPRRTVAPPPPLVSIRTATPSSKALPILLPIQDKEKPVNSSKKELNAPGLSPAKKAEESPAPEAGSANGSVPSGISSETVDPVAGSTNCVPVENGKMSPEAAVPTSEASKEPAVNSTNGEEGNLSELTSDKCSKETDLQNRTSSENLESGKSDNSALSDSDGKTEAVSAT